MSIKNNTASLQQLLEVVNNLPDAGSGGIELPELTNPANTDEIFLNKEVIDENGKVKTGTFTIDNEINTQEDLLSELRAALNGKAGGGEQVAPEISVNTTNGLITATAGTKSSTYQMAFQPAKTITPSTASQVAVSSGYYTGGNITVAAIPNNYIVPSGVLTISANGTHDVKNYASATVEIVDSDNIETIIDDVSKTIIEGTITNIHDDRIIELTKFIFCGQKNLQNVFLPSCIKMDQMGTYAQHYQIDAGHQFSGCVKLTNVNLPQCSNIGYRAFKNCRSLTSVNFPACTYIGSSAFEGCVSLTSVNFPACTSIDSSAFYGCTSLTSVNLPVCTNIGSNAFQRCLSLNSISFPTCTNICNHAFRSCASLTSVNLPICTNISNNAFSTCHILSHLILGASTVCTLNNSNAFYSTPYAGYSAYFSGTPHIYVPASLVSAYKSATNWTYFSSYITAIPSDY